MKSMEYLEMRALADALQQWGQPVVTGTSGAGTLDVLVTGTMHGHCLVIDEPVLYVRETVLI